MEKTIKKIEKDIISLSDSVKEPLSSIVGFIKKHKKIIIILAVIYFSYKYLFDEEDQYEGEEEEKY